MVRTQIQLGEAEYQRLRRAAARRGLSMAACIREGIDAFLRRAEADDESLSAVAGRFSPDGEGPVKDHDRWWADAALRNDAGRGP